MKYWRKLLSIILIIILSNVISSSVFAFNFYKFDEKKFFERAFFLSIKKAISNSEQGLAVIVVLKNTEKSKKVKEYLEKNGKTINSILQSKNNSKGLFFLYSGDYKLVFVFNNLLNEGFFTFKSLHTKRTGLVLDSDFINVLEAKLEKSSKVSVSNKFLQNLWSFFWILNYQLIYLNKCLVLLFTIIVILSVLEALICFNIFKTNLVNRYIIKLLPNTVLLSYLLIIYSPLIIQYTNHVFVLILLLLVISLILSFFSFKKVQTGLTLAGTFTILIQSIFYDNYLQIISTAGYHPSFANRFYGIGNEFFAYILGFIFVFSVVAKTSLRKVFIMLGALVVFLSIPYYGINFGGLISVLLGLFLFLLIESQNKRKIIYLALPIVILIGFAILNNSYLFSAFSNTGILFETVKRKLLMNLSYFISYPITILVVICFVALSILVLTRNKILDLSLPEREKITLFIIIAFFAWFLNDSGTIIVALLLGFLNLCIYLTELVKDDAKS